MQYNFIPYYIIDCNFLEGKSSLCTKKCRPRATFFIRFLLCCVFYAMARTERIPRGDTV